ncbi:hypothetical protein DFH11DRAFT_959359 [Phellopilus nigrolimitatus]|nr:hypothetical protein DFH11DRAFT_959359 [Phellopilus nigrolimitatus]
MHAAYACLSRLVEIVILRLCLSWIVLHYMQMFFFCSLAAIAHVKSTPFNSQARAGVSSVRCTKPVQPCSLIMTSGSERRRRARARRVELERHFFVSRLRALRHLKARRSR